MSVISNLGIGEVNIKTIPTLAVADQTISCEDFCKYTIFETSVGSATKAVIVPKRKKIFYVVNKDATLATLVKVAGQSTPVTIAATKSATLYFDGTNVRRLTADV